MEPLISVDLVSGCQRFQIQLICHHYAVIAGPVNSSTLIHPSHRAENPDTCCVSRASAIYFHPIHNWNQTSYFVLIYPLGFSFITNNYSWSLTHPNYSSSPSSLTPTHSQLTLISPSLYSLIHSWFSFLPSTTTRAVVVDAVAVAAATSPAVIQLGSSNTLSFPYQSSVMQ